MLAAWCLPRRRNSVETLGAALVMAANGSGHKTIAARLDRPEPTVRNWLRRARAGAERLRRAGVVTTHELDWSRGPTGMRTLAPGDETCVFAPGRQVHEICELCHLSPVPDGPVRLKRFDPVLLLEQQQGLADA